MEIASTILYVLRRARKYRNMFEDRVFGLHQFTRLPLLSVANAAKIPTIKMITCGSPRKFLFRTIRHRYGDRKGRPTSRTVGYQIKMLNYSSLISVVKLLNDIWYANLYTMRQYSPDSSYYLTLLSDGDILKLMLMPMSMPISMPFNTSRKFVISMVYGISVQRKNKIDHYTEH